MTISAKDVMTLRQRTGLGMMECKQALTEASGDFDAAEAAVRAKLGADMMKRSDREAGEGAIATAKAPGKVSLIQLKSETDFTAKNDAFLAAAQKIADLALELPDGEITPNDEINKLIDNLRITTKENISFARGVKLSGDKAGAYVHHNHQVAAAITGQGDISDDLIAGIGQHIVAADGEFLPTPLAIDEASLPAEKLEEARQAAIEEAKASGKPPEIAEKIAVGKTRKWVADHTLIGQPYARDTEDRNPIGKHLPKDAKLTAFVRYEI